jgi:hypothetical protein
MLHSLHHRELGSSHDGSKLVVGHVDGTLELGRVRGAEGGWTSITTVQDVRGQIVVPVFYIPFFCGAGLPPSSAFVLILAANEPCLAW